MFIPLFLCRRDLVAMSHVLFHRRNWRGLLGFSSFCLPVRCSFLFLHASESSGTRSAAAFAAQVFSTFGLNGKGRSVNEHVRIVFEKQQK